MAWNQALGSRVPEAPTGPKCVQEQGMRSFRSESHEFDVYSAAPANELFTATSEGFTFAADTMKSEMRGTISDLNREPLNTP